MTGRGSSLLPFRFFILFLALALATGAGAAPAYANSFEKTFSEPGPALEGKIREKVEKPAEPATAITLDPFFLIVEDASRVQVQRVLVALEFLQPDLLKKFDPQAPGLRELVYDFLVAKEPGRPARERKEQEQLLAGLLNRYLGQEAVNAVKVDQSFLLLR
ncbi:MAG: hypothetical protein C4567_08305 [Deltaproteobacteria bacterium]|nr:MAG: hypothetical protein C4567_08305 [Deltaproteobacteria bacterium]